MKGIHMTKIRFDVYAIKLTEENIPQIVEVTTKLGWTLDHLHDNMSFNAEDGFETILFMKLYKYTTEIATFNDEVINNPDQMYRLTNETDPKFGIFYKVETQD